MTIAPEQRRTVLDLPNPRSGWEEHMGCRNVDPTAFSLAPGQASAQRAAVRACNACPVHFDCLVDAVRGDDQATYRARMKPQERNHWLASAGIARAGASQQATKRGKADVGRILQMHRGGADTGRIASALGCSRETVLRHIRAARAEGLIP